MPDIAETGSYEILREDQSSACRITRAPSTARFYQAGLRDGPGVTLAAPCSGALRELLRGDHAGRPVSWEPAP